MQHNLTKVTLSKDELELVTNAQILLTKNEIIKKVYILFGSLAEIFVDEANKNLSHDLISIAPKISRGENYEGLPYVMLDYPRHFKKTEVFAIRTFFWWGNFTSITLQLSGTYKDRFAASIINAKEQGQLKEWYVNVGAKEWDHHFRNDNYQPVEKGIDLDKMPFIKLAKKIPLQEWDKVEEFLLKTFSLLMELLKD